MEAMEWMFWLLEENPRVSNEALQGHRGRFGNPALPGEAMRWEPQVLNTLQERARCF